MSSVSPAEPPELLQQVATLRGRAFTATALDGGLTNVNYRVQSLGEPPLDLVVRVSSNETGLLAIDRAAERYNTAMAWQAGVGAPVVEAVPEAGLLVIGFLPGRTLTAADLQSPDYAPRIAAALRQLHAGPSFQGTFDMRAIRRRYLALVTERGFRLPADYLDLTGRVELLEQAMIPGNEPLIPCNNDLLAANFIDDGERIWIIDYEYAGQNEASFELGNVASESGLDPAATRLLVDTYWGYESASKRARAQAWSLLARYGWTLWASIQDSVSPIDFDFWSWGMLKYDSARAEFLGPEFEAVIDGLSRTDAQ